MSSNTTAPRKSACFCNHCRKPHPRRDLDGKFLCAECRIIPGVRGHSDTSRRGIDLGTPAYWAATEHQLHIVGDDDPTPALDPAPTELVSTPEPTVRDWQHAMLSDREMDGEVKVALLRLSMFCDRTTGRNCWPSYEKVAAAIGRSRKQTRTLVMRGVAARWVKTKPRTMRGRGQTSNLYVLCWPDGRSLDG